MPVWLLMFLVRLKTLKRVFPSLIMRFRKEKFLINTIV
jgi:hypothetical protein